MRALLCHINLAAEYRGGERQTELLIRELAKRRWPQLLVVRRRHELLRRCADVAKLQFVQVPSNPFAAAFAARRAGLVHAHEARAVYSGAIASKLYGIPYLFTRRVPNPQRKSLLRRLAYEWSSAIVGVSQAVADSVKARQPSVDVRVVPSAHAALPSDTEAVARLRQRYDGKLLIGHVGALDHGHKGQLTIIEAARRAQSEGRNWQFLLCGSGKDELRFRDAIGELRNIELLGFLDGIGDFYASLDVFVFPSLKEAAGSAMIDAMQFGLPIVASDVDGIPEYVSDGVNGILIRPEQPDELYAAIDRVVGDEGLRERMRAANIEKSESLDAATMADRYEAIYAEILGAL